MLGANYRMRQEISGPAGSTGKDLELNISTQVLMQTSLRIFIGNWQKCLEGGVITDRSVTNQQESSAPVAMFASRQNWIMSRLREYHAAPAYRHWVYLSSSPCYVDERR